MGQEEGPTPMTNSAHIDGKDGEMKNAWGTAWSEDEVRYLRKHWPLGESASVIGKALGRSRRSVIGKVSRLGLNSRPCLIRDSTNKLNAQAFECLKAFIAQEDEIERLVQLEGDTDDEDVLRDCMNKTGDCRNIQYEEIIPLMRSIVKEGNDGN